MDRKPYIRAHAFFWLLFCCFCIVDDCPLTSMLDFTEIPMEQTLSSEEVDESFAIHVYTKVRVRPVVPARIFRQSDNDHSFSYPQVISVQLANLPLPSDVSRPALPLLGIFRI
ncbi:MAG: hypothetical protein K1X47_14165 [Cyclobacteriaceae bacterium]|nr:hypothetical protein [Cyclobacteriaceae bacterium]